MTFVEFLDAHFFGVCVMFVMGGLVADHWVTHWVNTRGDR